MGNESSPFFSVIMPTYNRVFCICNAIDSLLAQTYQQFEFIIVDDCSSDGTRELVFKKYANEFASKRFSYARHEKNMGLNGSRNTGLGLAKNDWILFLDDDNTLSPVFLKTYASAIMKNPDCKIFYSQLINLKNNTVVGQVFDYVRLCNANFIDAGVFLHHKSLYDTYGYYDTSLRRLTDWDFILRVTRTEKVFFIPQVLLNYNYVEGNFPRITSSEAVEPYYNKIQDKMSKIYYPFYENIKEISSINVFYDTVGGGVEQGDVYYHFPVSFPVPENVKKIIIKPCDRFCIVKDISIKAGGKDIPFTTNAYRKDGTKFYFDCDDPQVIVTLSDCSEVSFVCDMKVFNLDADIARNIKLDWKITLRRPLRWVKKIIRRIFKR